SSASFKPTLMCWYAGRYPRPVFNCKQPPACRPAIPGRLRPKRDLPMTTRFACWPQPPEAPSSFASEKGLGIEIEGPNPRSEVWFHSEKLFNHAIGSKARAFGSGFNPAKEMVHGDVKHGTVVSPIAIGGGFIRGNGAEVLPL